MRKLINKYSVNLIALFEDVLIAKRKKLNSGKIMDDDDNIYELDQSKYDYFDICYLASLPNYVTKKKYWEMFIFEIVQLFRFYRIIGETTHVLYTKRQFIDTFKCVSKFAKKWMLDPAKKSYDLIRYIPYNGVKQISNTKIYNDFSGYNPLIMNPYNKNNSEHILRAYMDITLALCEDNNDYHDYFVHFIADLIQYPSKKNHGHCIVFKSNEGVGKNVTLNAISNVIGESNYISSADPDDFLELM